MGSLFLCLPKNSFLPEAKFFHKFALPQLNTSRRKNISNLRSEPRQKRSAASFLQPRTFTRTARRVRACLVKKYCHRCAGSLIDYWFAEKSRSCPGAVITPNRGPSFRRFSNRGGSDRATIVGRKCESRRDNGIESVTSAHERAGLSVVKRCEDANARTPPPRTASNLRYEVTLIATENLFSPSRRIIAGRNGSRVTIIRPAPDERSDD